MTKNDSVNDALLKVVMMLMLLAFVRSVHGGLQDGEVTAPLGGDERQGLEVLYVNGFSTSELGARREAEALGKGLGVGIRLVWNDLTSEWLDWGSITIEKLGDADVSVNAATSTLTGRLIANACTPPRQLGAHGGDLRWIVSASAAASQ